MLTTFARARLRAGGVAETEWTPELDRALRQDFPAEADAGRAGSVSEGDLARQAMLLLADDPQYREANLATSRARGLHKPIAIDPLVSLCDALRAAGLPARGRDARPEKLDRTSPRGTC